MEDRRSDRESAFERVRPIVEAKAVLPGATKKGVHEMLLHLHNDPPLPGYGGVHRLVPQAGGRLRLPLPGGAPALRDAAGPPAAVRLEGGREARRRERRGPRVQRVDGGPWATRGGTASSPRGRGPLTTCSRACWTPSPPSAGVPEEALTDNMSVLVTFSGGRRSRVERAWRFAEEAGFRLAPCRPGSPETRGRDESANRFLSRPRAPRGRVHGLGGAPRVRGAHRAPQQRGARRDHRPAAERPVHAREGGPRAGRQHAAAAGDGPAT